MAYNRERHGSVQPAWRKESNKPEGRMMGIEFEIEHPDGFDRILEALPEPRDPKNTPVTERDGSLNDHCGVEIVFPPYKYAAFKSGTSFFARAMKALEEAGVESTVNCGMHMNINTTGWTADQRTAFVFFLHRFPRACIERIGGRTLNGYCNQYPELTFTAAATHTQHVTLAGLRPNRIEVRFPKATTDLNRVKNLTNFFELLEDYVKQDDIRQRINQLEGVPLRNDFYAWLDNNTARPLTSARIKEVLTNGYPA